MPHGIQWPLNHLSSRKNSYIFIYFGMPLKMDDINVFIIFMFIQIDIKHKYKLHIYATAKHFVAVCATTNYFYQVLRKIVVFKVAKMIDLDKSRKCMG